MPDTGFISDAEMAKIEGAKPAAAPQAAVAPADTGFVSDADMAKYDQGQAEQAAKFGSPRQQFGAGLEGIARGFSLGTSDLAEQKLGIATPEEIKGRMEANPFTSTIGNIAGGAGLIGLTGGIAAPAEAALGGGYAASALGYGLEGGLFGASNAVTDYALGDPDLNAEKVISHIGYGAALGAGLGLLGRAIRGAPIVPEVVSNPEAAGPSGPSGPGSPIMSFEETEPGKPIKSFKDLQDRVAAAQSNNTAFELPQKSALVDAVTGLPDLEHPVLPQQLDSLNSQSDQTNYKILRNTDNEVGKAIQNYESLQKNEVVNKLNKTISDLAPGHEPVADAVKSGNQAIEIFTKNYEEEQKQLRPVFKALEKIDLGSMDSHIWPLMNNFADALPGVASMLKYDENGIANGINAYSTKWGIDKATYNAVKDVYHALESGGDEASTFNDLRNIRKGMDQNINVMDQGQAPQEIRALKAAFMDYIQHNISESLPEGGFPVRELFKRWAINEQQRGVIEKAFGASVGKQEFGAISKVKPESIVDNIFKNTATVNAAKQILSPEDFNKLLANHLAEQKDLLTKNNVFSSNRFASYLKRNQDALNVAFADRPAGLKRLKDLSTFATILPDAPSINPSGTAKTLIGMLKDVNMTDLAIGMHNIPAAIGKKAFQIINEKRAASAAVKEFNQGLAGKAAQQARLQQAKNILNQVDNAINKAAIAIFENKEDHR